MGERRAPSRSRPGRRLEALNEFVAAFESEHGEIAAAEIMAAQRSARARAVVVRDSAA